jgi:sugar phosphate isomerase/epimerase
VLRFGIQLYSVRDQFARDVPATLAGVKRAGFDHVELFGVGPVDAERWRPMLKSAGLNVVAAHVDYDIVRDDLPGVIHLARTLNFEDVIVPWLKLDSAKEWEDAAATMDACGASLRGAGLRLGYHNHDHEFEALGNTTAFKIIFDRAKPENLFLELDVRWASEFGGDANAIIRDFGPRCRLLHLKERPKDGKGFTELGRGLIDWPAVVAAGRKAGVQCYIAEQDESAIGVFESAAINADYLRTL